MSELKIMLSEVDELKKRVMEQGLQIEEVLFRVTELYGDGGPVVKPQTNLKIIQGGKE